MMEMELPGKRRRGRPKRRFVDVVKEDMGEVGAKEMDIEDRKVWRMMIRCDHPSLKGKAERRRIPKIVVFSKKRSSPQIIPRFYSFRSKIVVFSKKKKGSSP